MYLFLFILKYSFYMYYCIAAVSHPHPPCFNRRLSPQFPYLECEVRYAVREMARTAIDVLARRTRLAFLDNEAARSALPAVVRILGDELNWDFARRQRELAEAEAFLSTMQVPTPVAAPAAPPLKGAGKKVEVEVEVGGK